MRVKFSLCFIQVKVTVQSVEKRYDEKVCMAVNSSFFHTVKCTSLEKYYLLTTILQTAITLKNFREINSLVTSLIWRKNCWFFRKIRDRVYSTVCTTDLWYVGTFPVHCDVREYRQNWFHVKYLFLHLGTPYKTHQIHVIVR